MIQENPSITGSNGYYPSNKNDTNEIKKIISGFLSNWHWFFLSVALAVVIAFIYNRYTPPVYEIQSTLLVNEDNSNSPLSALYGTNQGMFQERMFTDWTNIYNQVAILSSTPIVSMTLAELDFDVSYYSLGRVSETEMYKNAPFRIVWDKNHPQIVESNFYLSILPDNTISISTENENVRVYDYKQERVVKTLPEFSIHQQILPDSCLRTEEFCFTVVLNDHFNPGNYMFRFHAPGSLVSRYRSMLKVSLLDNNSSILHLSVSDYNITKGIDFLNKIIEIYQYNNLEKKNQYANLTIQFIDSQLQNISDSLSISENRLESFRSANQMIDFSAQSRQLLIQINELDKELVKRETQHKYYNYLKNYIDSNQELETVIAPSSVGIDDPLLNGFIIQLNELINKKSSQTSIVPNSEHPTFKQLNNQIETVKKSLIQSVNNIIAQSEVELENLNQRMRNFNAQIRRLPATERNFVNFERKYKIDSETYTFLLQKLSEARIAKASNTPDGQVLEAPQMKAVVKPQKRKVYSLAFLFGMFLPAGIIFLREFFNNKIISHDDVKAITTYPVIGHVFRDALGFESNSLVLNKPNSGLGNSYVSIRTKLILLTQEKKHPVIAVTSAIPREGKTYNAVNIATSIALSHKTAVILDLDLRNSKMAEIFNLNQGKGVVNYIEGNASLEEITFNTPLKGLKVIPAGLLPPNPAEMLTDVRLGELVDSLKKNYDVVVIDSSPVGFVADIFQLRELIDATLLIVRHKFTTKQTFRMALEEVEKHQMKGIGIIVNSIFRERGSYGFGGNRYGSGNGCSYEKGKSGIGKVKQPVEEF